MKFVMDEKLKHRLIGLAVIISLGAIFAPAVLRKSSQHVENNFSVSVKLPPKPAEPNVSVTDEKDMFKTIKVARVAIPSVSGEKQLPELVRAESINPNEQQVAVNQPVAESKLEPIKLAINESAKASVHKAIMVAANKPKTANKPVALAKAVVTTHAKAVIKPRAVVQVAKTSAKPQVKRDLFAVQLASFSQVSNAQALVGRLKAKGYRASYARTIHNGVPIYKVFAGLSPVKNDVLKLKTQIAASMQLNGFVVNTGVS